MVEELQSGKQMAEICREHGRSMRAMFIRLGSILARPVHHPDHIANIRIDPVLMHRAKEAYEESRASTSGLSTSGLSTPRADLEKVLSDIQASIEELRGEVRKLRVDVRKYHKEDRK